MRIDVNPRTDEARLFQISTTAALVQGVLQGALSSSLLLKNGDFGVGTFEDLDGEMVILGGKIYQVLANEAVVRRTDDFLIPFAQVCRLRSSRAVQIELVGSLAGLEEACNKLRTSDNLFYAFRIDARFDTLHARSVRSSPTATSLETAGSNEAKFAWNNTSGSLVGLWSPQFSSSFSVPGYHFHFISDDRRTGGHLLDCSFRMAVAHVQVLTEYEVALPSSGPFLRANLTVDTKAVLEKVE